GAAARALDYWLLADRVAGGRPLLDGRQLPRSFGMGRRDRGRWWRTASFVAWCNETVTAHASLSGAFTPVEQPASRRSATPEKSEHALDPARKGRRRLQL